MVQPATGVSLPTIADWCLQLFAVLPACTIVFFMLLQPELHGGGSVLLTEHQ